MLIPLTQGFCAIVDDSDAWVGRWRWYYLQGYAVRKEPTYNEKGNGPRQRMVLLHRQLLGVDSGVQVDHRDGNTLNNRRNNLRPASSSQNQQNRKCLSTNTSGFRGVTFNRALNRWQAGLKYQNRSQYLGLFATPQDAARAYDLKALELFGEFANLNFPEAA